MTYLWWTAWHVISMVAWFSALFYLPRLFVYHAMSEDQLGQQRFCVMEHKLYYYIGWPAAVLTTFFGIGLVYQLGSSAWHMLWLPIKLALVLVLWLYHLSAGYFIKRIKHHPHDFSHVFFRWYNEVPTILLVCIVILVVVKPF